MNVVCKAGIAVTFEHEMADRPKVVPRVLNVASGASWSLPEDYVGYEVLDISYAGDLVALRSSGLMARGKNRTRLVVASLNAAATVQFETTAYLTYRARFDAHGKSLLVDALAKKPFSLDVASGALRFEFDLKKWQLYAGAISRETNEYWIPETLGPFRKPPRKPAAVLRLDLEAGKTSVTKEPFGKEARVVSITSEHIGNRLYVALSTGEVACVGPDFSVVWRCTYPEFEKDGFLIDPGSAFVVTVDDKLVVAEVAHLKGDFGEYAVIETQSGKLLRRIKQEREGIGLLAAALKGHRVAA
jgi:putative transposon-encoded protein